MYYHYDEDGVCGICGSRGTWHTYDMSLCFHCLESSTRKYALPKDIEQPKPAKPEPDKVQDMLKLIVVVYFLGLLSGFLSTLLSIIIINSGMFQ